MARPLIPDDDPQQFAALMERVRRLEQASNKKLFIVDPGSNSINLGPIDGDDITGVRISGHGNTSGTGGDTVIRLVPNNVAWSTSLVSHRTYTGPGPGYAATSDTIYGGALVSSAPAIAVTAFGTSGATVSFDGILFTSRVFGQVRQYIGTAMTQDRITDGQRYMNSRLAGTYWNDTTPFTSLTITQDAGTFRGRISIEYIL